MRREIDDELRAAFDLLVDENVRAGMPLDAARRTATLALGNVAALKEQVSDVRAGAAADAFLQDVRYGTRLLRRNPLFTLTAALSLAIGIGANTTIFTIANGLLFRAPGGLSDPDALLDVYRAEEGRAMANFTHSYPYYLDVRERTKTLAAVFAYEFELQPVNLGHGDVAELAFANHVTPNYFTTLGVMPAAGRLFTPSDEGEAGAAPIAVLSHRVWLRRFNGDAAMVGRTIRINRHPFTVIGVAREGFHGTNVVAPDLWVPMAMADTLQPGTPRLVSRRHSGVGIGARLEPGMTTAQAAAELDTIARALAHENPTEDHRTRLRVAGLSSLPGPVAKVAAGFFALLLALVSVVLVIACANVAGVLLARAAARRREIAVRIAIGAGRARLMRQLLTETLLLFVLAGAAGLFLARQMTSLLLRVLPAFPVPIDMSPPLDGRVIVFTGGLSLVAAVLAGLAPALHASRADVVSGLKDESQGPPERLRTRNAFVIAQIAFSILLVILAGLLMQGLQRSGSINRRFDPRGVEVVSIDLSRGGYTPAAGALFARDLMERLRMLPGVEAATLSEFPPAAGGWLVRLNVPGVSPADGQAFVAGVWNAVDASYFTTLRIPFLAGRDFNAADRASAEPVVIVSETAARTLWPGQDPIGKYLVRYGASAESDGASRIRVVGVARDLTSATGGRPTVIRDLRPAGAGGTGPAEIVRDTVPLTMYVPLQQHYIPRLTMLVRTGDGKPKASEIRALVRTMDPDLLLPSVQSLEAQSGPGYVQLRIAAPIAASLGLVGLLLASMGIYGVTAYTTARRTREIGIRMAMGAGRADILQMVLRHGMSLVVVGSVLGMALAGAATRLFARLLFGVAPLDPVTFGGAALLFAVIGLAACYVPARRATRIQAIDALRYE
jgi:predicted permease